MQVIIEEVVSRIRAMDGGAGLSADTLRSIVDAVVSAVEEKQRHHENVDEEHSLRNYQQRNQPWSR
ncbi:MAG: hypothetical protein GY916_06960 [Gammaproteobacteria bacterium]|nr:hypothetical protein [Gammaproteobacteria bacterium]